MQKIHDSLSNKISWYGKWHERESHQHFHFLIFAAVTIISGTLLLGNIDNYAKGFDGSESYPIVESVDKMNDRAIKELKVFENSTGAEKQNKIQSLKKILTNRKAKILEKMASGDKNISSEFMPDEIRSRMPDTVRELIEEKIEATGNLSILFFDGVNDQDSKVEYSLEVYDSNTEESSNYNLLLGDGNKFNLKGGSKIKVKGFKLDDKVFVAYDSGSSSVQVLNEPALADVLGTKSLLVIPVSFNDNTSQPIAQADLYNIYFNNSDSPNKLITEASYGKVSLSGAVTPWMQINTNYASGCSYSNWGYLADQAATAAGYNVSSYNHVQYYLNGTYPVCNWGGLGYMNNSRSFINGSVANHGSKAHELGHNFGAYHSGFLSCDSMQINTLSLCNFDNYGEQNEKMGRANNFQFTSPKRGLFGWIPATQIKSVTSSADFTVASDYSTNTTLPKILKIAKPDTGDNYYISFKQAAGFNASLGEGNTRGASIYYKPNSTYTTTGVNDSDTVLLTAQPGGGYTNSALWDGGSFVDPVNGITVTQTSHTADSVNLSVTLSTPPCTPSSPYVSVSPASKTGPAGSSLSYTVSITNTNSTYCSSSTFGVNPSVPVGFTGSSASLNIAPGSSASTNVNVSSGSSIIDGNYGFTVVANDTANTGSSASAAGTYIVYTPPVDTTVPTVTITSPISGTKIGSRVDIKASASDNIGVAKVEFYIDNKLTATDTSAPYSYRWNVNRKIPAGTHTIMVKAYDAAGNSGTNSVSVTK